MSTTIETVSFKLLENVAVDAFIDANDGMDSWLKSQPGFVSRSLSLDDESTWLDVVVWNTKNDAEAAAQKFMQDMGECDIMKMINPESVVMKHSQQYLAC